MSERFYKEGPHRARVSAVELIETASGKPAILLSVRPFAAIVSADGEIPIESKYDQRIYLMAHDDKSRDYTLRKLRHAGWDGDSFETLESDMQGREIEVYASDDEFNGEPTTRWNLQLPKREAKPVATRSFNALFANLLKADAKTRPAKTPKRSKPVASQVAEDDVPF